MVAHAGPRGDQLGAPVTPQEPPAEVALIVVLSPMTVAHVGQLAQAGWDGPVLAVGSVEEARALLDSSQSGARPAAPSMAPHGAPPPAPHSDTPQTSGTAAREEARHSAYPPSPAKAQLSPAPAPSARPNGLLLDPDRRRIVHDGRERTLTPLEFGVLEVLMQRAGQVQRFAELTRLVWGTAFTGDSGHLHAVVRRLRRKLEGVRAPVELVAVRGVGFRLSGVAVVDDPRREPVDPSAEPRSASRSEPVTGPRGEPAGADGRPRLEAVVAP